MRTLYDRAMVTIERARRLLMCVRNVCVPLLNAMSTVIVITAGAKLALP